MKIIPSIIYSLVALLCAGTVSAQSYYEFVGNLSGPVDSRNTAIEPLLFEATVKGGKIRLAMPDTAEQHTGVYEFEWKFIDDISKMVEGKEYKFGITGRRIHGTAEKNTAIANLKSSNQGSKLADKERYENPGNTISLAVPFANVHAYPKGENNSVNGVVKVNSVGGRSYFSIDFSFGSHPYSATSKNITYSIVYVFDGVLVKEQH